MSVCKISCCLLLVWLRPAQGQGLDYEELTEQDILSNEYYVYYDNVIETENMETSSVVAQNQDITGNRIRRYEDKVNTKTLSPEDINNVRGALQQWLGGVGADNPFTPHTTPLLDYRPSLVEQYASTTTPIYTVLESLHSAKPGEDLTNTFVRLTRTSKLDKFKTTLRNVHKHYKLEEGFGSLPTRSTKQKYEIKSNIDSLNSILDQKEDSRRYILRQSLEQNITNATTTSTSPKSPELDIPRLLAIISELANDFETNLTLKLNETLIRMSIPTCSTPTTTVTTPVTGPYDAKYTGSIIAKCFVCGLDIPRIPQHAHCADAFAGDFLPLVPVDASAKGKISRYRKYCKYSNVHGYQFNETQPRAIFGRWTGGCAVRWIDLSGVYTQRTCRNRMRPTMGKHFASKRMAKLERSLWNVENGCIISPMATLVPLSRGISLYARFHACVCTGDWCNACDHGAHAPTALLSLILSTAVIDVT